MGRIHRIGPGPTRPAIALASNSPHATPRHAIPIPIPILPILPILPIPVPSPVFSVASQKTGF